jgi:tetratricopeptide (TPR) repeat protein
MVLICSKYGCMLKRFLPFLISLLSFSAANAQMYNADHYYRSAMEFKKNNQFPEALADLTKAVSLNKKFDSAYFELGNIYVSGGYTDQGIDNYKKALAINPKYTEALIAMGKIYRDSRQNFDSALIYYHAAAKIDSNNKDVFYALAWTYNARKEYDKAIPNAVKALEIDNTYKPAYGELGHAYRASKKFAECIEQLKKNLAVSVVDLAYLYSGFAYLELKNKEGAMQQYEELKKINEKMANSLKKKIDVMEYTEIGNREYALKNYDEALVNFTKALALEKSELNLYYTGLCYIGKNDKESALKTISDLKAMNSKYAKDLQDSIDKM